MLQNETSCHQYLAWLCLTKGTGHPEAYQCLPAACKAQPPKDPQEACKLGEAGSQGVTRVRWVVFTGFMQIQIWPCWEKAQNRKDGTHLLAVWEDSLTQGHWWLSLQPLSWSHITQFLPVCLWCSPNFCPTTGAQTECLKVSESVYGPFKRNAFRLTEMNRTLIDFHSQMLWGFLFPALVLQDEELCMGLGPLIPQENLWGWDIPSNSQPSHVGVGPDPFSSLPLLPVLTWLLYILRYRTSVQLIFRWFTRLIVL